MPKCGSRYLAKMGMGTQQIEDALISLLPDDVAVIRMDADSTKGKDAHKRCWRSSTRPSARCCWARR